MSLAAYIWAANLPLSACNGTPFRVLLLLADRADELGYGAYPHVSTIADTLECSGRTVQRAIRELVQSGLLRVGDQRYVEHLDPRYRPTVYDVLTAALLYNESRGDNSDTPDESRGDRSGHPGVTTAVAHRTVQEPSYQDTHRHLTLVTAQDSAMGSISQPGDALVDVHLPVEGLLADRDAAVVVTPVLDGERGADRDACDGEHDARAQGHIHPSLHGAQRTGRTA